MARKAGGIGPGALKMGGGGMKPKMPPTPMAGAPIGPGASGRPPPAIRPTTGPGAIGGGRPPPAPPGLSSGAGPGGAPIAGGFAKGGSVKNLVREEKREHGGKIPTVKEERMEKYAKGGPVKAK